MQPTLSQEPSVSPTGSPSAAPVYESATCVSSSTFVDEEFDVAGAGGDWLNGFVDETIDGTKFLSIESGSPVSTSFDIPTENGLLPSVVNFEFVVYQIGTWSSEDTLVLKIGSTEITLGDVVSSPGSGLLSSETDGLVWLRDTVSEELDLGFGSTDDKKYIVEVEIPVSYFSEGALPVELVTSSQSGVIGITDVMMTAVYECVYVPTCVSSLVALDEEFDDDSSVGVWNNGVWGETNEVSGFLGPLESGTPVYRSVKIPDYNNDILTSVTLEFSLYQFGVWSDDDTIRVIIGSTVVRPGEFASSGSSGMFSGEENGIVWWRDTFASGQDYGFGYTSDKKYLVEMSTC